MRLDRGLFSAVQWLFVLFFLGIGGAFLSVVYFRPGIYALWLFLESHPSFCFGVGSGLVGWALLWGWVCFAGYRKAYFQIQLFHGLTQVSPSLIETVTEDYWRRSGLEGISTSQVLVRRGREIEIVAEAPPMDPLQWERIEEELTEELFVHLGYRYPLTMTVVCRV